MPLSSASIYRVECQVTPERWWCDSIKHSCPSQSSQHLGNHVEDSAEEGELWAQKEGHGDCRIDVGTAHVA